MTTKPTTSTNTRAATKALRINQRGYDLLRAIADQQAQERAGAHWPLTSALAAIIEAEAKRRGIIERGKAR
jgi:hypothetical protein